MRWLLTLVTPGGWAFSLISYLDRFVSWCFLHWKQIAVLLMSLYIIFSIEQYGYSRAYNDRTSYYEKILQVNRDNINNKLTRIEGLATTLAKNGTDNHTALIKDLDKLTIDLNKKKLFTITKTGECVPSKDFIDTYNSIIFKGNSK